MCKIHTAAEQGKMNKVAIGQAGLVFSCNIFSIRDVRGGWVWGLEAGFKNAEMDVNNLYFLPDQ